jgi:hypothetical protein
VYRGATALVATSLLRLLLKIVHYQIHTGLTDNRIRCADAGRPRHLRAVLTWKPKSRILDQNGDSR